MPPDTPDLAGEVATKLPAEIVTAGPSDLADSHDRHDPVDSNQDRQKVRSGWSDDVIRSPPKAPEALKPNAREICTIKRWIGP